MHKRASLISLLAISLFFCNISFAETIVFKSGKTEEGRIIERNDKYIKLDLKGVQLIYFLDDIQSIDGKDISTIPNTVTQKRFFEENLNMVSNTQKDISEVVTKDLAFGDKTLSQPGKATEKNIKADKGFGAQLWLTDDMEFVKKWNTPGAGVQIKKVNVAERGKPIQLITFFAGPGVDAKGLCDISSDITVYAPDGLVYGELKDVKCWKDLPVSPSSDIQMSQGTMAIMIEGKDKTRRYR